MVDLFWNLRSKAYDSDCVVQPSVHRSGRRNIQHSEENRYPRGPDPGSSGGGREGFLSVCRFVSPLSDDAPAVSVVRVPGVSVIRIPVVSVVRVLLPVEMIDIIIISHV